MNLSVAAAGRQLQNRQQGSKPSGHTDTRVGLLGLREDPTCLSSAPSYGEWASRQICMWQCAVLLEARVPRRGFSDHLWPSRDTHRGQIAYTCSRAAIMNLTVSEPADFDEVRSLRCPMCPCTDAESRTLQHYQCLACGRAHVSVVRPGGLPPPLDHHFGGARTAQADASLEAWTP